MLFLSIVIPAFNAGEHLEEALASLARQTFRDFEVIVIDNLSSDNTRDIFTQFQEDFPNAVWISEKDQGIYDAMNKGVKMAMGEWIYFLGSDDRLHNETVLAEVHQFILTRPQTTVIYGNILSTAYQRPYDGVFTAQKIYMQNISHQAIFAKRSVFSIVGLFSSKYRVLADWDHNLRWFFSEKVTHTHFDLIVADYGVDGVSSKITDTIFYRDRDWNYVASGRRRLGLVTKLRFIYREWRECARERNFARLFIKMIHSPAIIFGI